ncbi:hypothetical protein COCON_G00235360, partial [Conger conger]
ASGRRPAAPGADGPAPSPGGRLRWQPPFPPPCAAAGRPGAWRPWLCCGARATGSPQRSTRSRRSAPPSPILSATTSGSAPA